MMPKVGLKPTMPQYDAGRRTDEPVSVPYDSGPMRAATAAAEPPLEPPAMRSVFHGLCTGPKCDNVEVPPWPNSSKLVLPKITAPAARSFSTSVESRSGIQSCKIFEPPVV